MFTIGLPSLQPVGPGGPGGVPQTTERYFSHLDFRYNVTHHTGIIAAIFVI